MIAHIEDPNATYNHTGVGNAPILDSVRNAVYARQRGCITGFDLDTNTALWSVTADYQGKMAFDGEYLYANNGTELTAVDVETGVALWVWEAGEELEYNVIETDNLVITSSATATYAIDKSTHQQVWSTIIGGRLTLSGQGGLLIANQDGTLALFDVEGDSDEDGLPNWYEREVAATNPWKADASEDYDKDGLSALTEYEKGTSPLVSDTDGDGLSDSDELNRYETNPLKVDTDDDTVADALELEHGLNPLVKGDGFADANDDGYTNSTELNGLSDINNPESLPSVFSETIDFENRALADGMSVMGNRLDWKWDIANLPSSQYGLTTNGTSTLVLEGVFDYGEVIYDYRSSCNSLDVYVDGWKASTVGYTGNAWNTHMLALSQGVHRVEWITSDCGEGRFSLDNISFTKTPEIDVAALAVYSYTREVQFIDHDGETVERLVVPKANPGCCDYVRDFVVLGDNRIAFVNGTFSGSLTLFDPRSGFLNVPLYQWHTVNNGTFGGIDAFGDYVFMSATAISQGPFNGFVRVNTKTLEVDYVQTETSYDVTVGQDGYFYTLGDAIHKYDLDTLEYLGEVLDENARGIAVDTESNIYLATWGGPVRKYSGSGELIGESTLTGSFYDINIHESGYLMVSDRDEKVSILNSDLETVGNWSDKGNFSAWGVNVDIDLLGFSEAMAAIVPLARKPLIRDDGMDSLGFVNGGQPPENP